MNTLHATFDSKLQGSAFSQMFHPQKY